MPVSARSLNADDKDLKTVSVSLACLRSSFFFLFLRYTDRFRCPKYISHLGTRCTPLRGQPLSMCRLDIYRIINRDGRTGAEVDFYRKKDQYSRLREGNDKPPRNFGVQSQRKRFLSPFVSSRGHKREERVFQIYG